MASSSSSSPPELGEILRALKSVSKTQQRHERAFAKKMEEAKDRENEMATNFKSTLEAALAKLGTQSSSRRPSEHDDADSSDDDKDQACRPVRVASASKSDLKGEALTKHTIDPLCKMLSTATWRKRIDADLLQLFLQGFIKGDSVTLDPAAHTIIAALLRFATQQPHLACTSPPELRLTEAHLARTAKAVCKANQKELSHAVALKLLGHVRTRLADHTVQILLHYTDPEGEQGLPETPLHKNCGKIPDRRMEALASELAEARRPLDVSEEYKTRLASNPDHAPPLAVMLSKLVSSLNSEGEPLYLSAESPAIKAFEELIDRLGCTFDTTNFPYGLLAYVLCVAQYKLRIVQKTDRTVSTPRAKLSFETMPAPKSLADTMIEMVEFLQDTEACPTSYFALNAARGVAVADDDDDDTASVARTEDMGGARTPEEEGEGEQVGGYGAGGDD